MTKRRVDLDGASHLALVSGATLLHPEETVFEAMLEGWTRQMRSRLVSQGSSIEPRIRLVKRFAEFTNDYPWRWTPGDLEDWTSSLISGMKPIAHPTARSYQHAIAMFLDYVCDDRYGWGEECESRFGTHPVQLCHEWNMVSHANGYEGRPEVRPFTRDELQAFFDHADSRVETARRLGRKGWMAAFRDAALFKVIYAWGLRRREAAKLDVTDFGPNAAAPEFGNFGMLSVRWGKAVAGSSPRRRNTLTVFDWSVEIVHEYLAEVRPLYLDGAALWPTERGGRISVDLIGYRFIELREELGLPDELHPHCLRHSYTTHLIEDGFDPFFVQQQVGHRWASTTALYTGVSSDFKNRMLRRALDRAFVDDTQEGTNQ
jgi:integrase/recombinase XerC